MNGENRPLVTNEPVEVQDFRRKDQLFQRNPQNISRIDKGKPKDRNM